MGATSERDLLLTADHLPMWKCHGTTRNRGTKLQVMIELLVGREALCANQVRPRVVGAENLGP